MKYLLILLLAFFGNSAISAVHSNPNANSGFASTIESKGKLIQWLKTDFMDTFLLQQLVQDTKKFDDYSATYSQSVLPMVAELRSLIVNADDNSFDAIRPVYGWCSKAKDLIEAYISLSQEKDADTITARNEIIENLINDDFIIPLSEKLEQLSNNLNKASQSVSSILNQFDSDFSEQSAFFESTLREELVRDKNKRYTPELINNVVRALITFGSNPSQSMLELATAKGFMKTAEVALGQQKASNPVFQQQQQQQQQNYQRQQQQQRQYGTESPAGYQGENRSPTMPTPTVDPKLYMEYKNHVLSQFAQARDFFKNFDRQLDKTMSHVNDVKLKVLENNQSGQTSKITETTPLQMNQIKNAAQSLKMKCKNFNLKP